MIINEFWFRNYKSYGNKEQRIKLNKDKGELILLSGPNGGGKSSLIETIEYVNYNKVKSNKKKKSATLSTLPNRINGDMLCGIDMDCGGTNVVVRRGIQPAILELEENGIPNERAGKANIDAVIQKYVGMDIDTFKSFISMSINDFKNFISLSTEDKQLLLDKLFNLEIINILNNLLKTLNSQNKKDITKYDSEVYTLEDSIRSIRNSINKSLEKEKSNLTQEIDELKAEVESKKDEFIALKNKVEKINEKNIELNGDLEKERDQYTKIKYEISKVQTELNLYDQGKCPTCGSDFHTEHFINLKQTLIDKKESLVGVQKEIEQNGAKLKARKLKLDELSRTTNTMFSDIKMLVQSNRSKIEQLQKKALNESTSNDSIAEFERSLDDMISRKGNSENKLVQSKEKESYYKELNKILGEDGVKKTIISGIIKPINYFIQENLKSIGFPFTVQLDETFTATISIMGKEIDQDSLSTGENKIINVCIMLSYLNLIRTKKYVNVLFLDEVFSSIDLSNVDKILHLLRNFATEHKINIFVVHHAVLKQELFDRIIQIKKNVFSYIEETK